MRFKNATAVSVKITAFFGETPCSVVGTIFSKLVAQSRNSPSPVVGPRGELPSAQCEPLDE